jgi:HEAT repeat protein
MFWVSGRSSGDTRQTATTLRAAREFRDEVRPLLEWDLTSPDHLTTIFRRRLTDVRESIISILGEIGDAETAVLLEPYVDDAGLGRAAISAIHQICREQEA